MAFTSNVNMTGSKYFAYFIAGAGLAATIILKEALPLVTAIPASIALYMNKQYQDRMIVKYENENTENKA